MFSSDIDAILGQIRDENMLPRIETIPSIIVDNTGRYTDTFKHFYDVFTESVFEQNWQKLYETSDKAIKYPDFLKMVESIWGKFFHEFNTTPATNKGFCTDINVIRFKQPHGKLLSSFLVNIYRIHSNSDSLTDRGMKLRRYSTEVWFTYKNNRFCVVSALQPFVEVRD